MITLHRMFSYLAPIRGASMAAILSTTRDLRACAIYNQDLRGADLSRVNLWRTTFQDCDLTGCILDYALVKRTRFVGCKMDGVSMRQWPTPCSANYSAQ